MKYEINSDIWRCSKCGHTIIVGHLRQYAGKDKSDRNIWTSKKERDNDSSLAKKVNKQKEIPITILTDNTWYECERCEIEIHPNEARIAIEASMIVDNRIFNSIPVAEAHRIMKENSRFYRFFAKRKRFKKWGERFEQYT